MLFNSYEYFLLLLITIIICFFRKANEHKIYTLLISSYLFYASWGLPFLLILVAATFTGYLFSWQIYFTKKNKSSFTWLCSGVSTYILFLLYFKFINISILSNSYLIPIGVSFYSLQLISYFVDINKGKLVPERNFFKFALYISFFPQILAGPIERGRDFFLQINQINLTWINFHVGSKIILIGLFKKVLIADKLGIMINPIYQYYEEFNGFILLIGTVLFSFQIYCDFSGYTDIALGSAMVFGIKLSSNFKKPYLAVSFKDFWHRWHISLSQWFRDYLYIPLGGNKVGSFKKGLIVFFVFVISGMWHGIGYTFLVWGGLHALSYVLEESANELLFFKKILPTWLKRIFIFFMVTLYWIFFKSIDLKQSFGIVNKVIKVHNFELQVTDLNRFYSLSALNFYSTLFILFNLICFLVIDFLKVDEKFIQRKTSIQPSVLDLILINYIVFLLIIFGDWGGEQFIYFQF